MDLTEFRIKNYRSVSDSGPIKASKITAILGRNESGKSNLLRALHSLNPADGFKALDKSKNFPRHRRLEECQDNTPVVETTWRLNDADRKSLASIWPRGGTVTAVRITRSYSASRTVGFVGLKSIEFDHKLIKTKVRKIVPAVKAQAAKLDDAKRQTLEAAADTFETKASENLEALDWAKAAVPACKALRQALATANAELSEAQDALISELEDLSSDLSSDEDNHQKAREWAIKQLPIFIYLEDYPELKGHQNLATFLQKKSQGVLTDAEKNFEKMCKVAGLNPQELQALLQQSQHETRNQLANRASAVITTEIRRLWKDRPLKVRFNPDAEHLDTFISDPNSTFDVEVNLDERSRGFQWFFAFYITFAADTKGGSASNAILLLDEPGLYLHAKSQRDLLTHFESDFQNQIIYTTHSPFMVPTHKLDAVRTVSISETEGTTVSNDPNGDARTLFPLQAALGYDLAQSLFVGPNNLVVEGVTDFWILSAISEYLNANGGSGLRQDVTITPAGGAQKIPYMVALLTSEQLKVLVLLDKEKQAQQTSDDLVKGKLINDKMIVFVSEAFNASPAEADIEDLLAPALYEDLVRKSYAKELKAKKLEVNEKIPRIAVRFQDAFEKAGIEFHKTRPMRMLLSRMASEPEKVCDVETVDRFSRLFDAINKKL